MVLLGKDVQKLDREIFLKIKLVQELDGRL